MYAEVVFPELEKELKKNPKIIGNVRGVFEVTITVKKKVAGVWYIILSEKPSITTVKPQKIDKEKLVTVELEDTDMLKMISGGMNGIKAYTSGKLKISGDFVLAKNAEKVFIKAGGVKKVMSYIRKNYPQTQSKL